MANSIIVFILIYMASQRGCDSIKDLARIAGVTPALAIKKFKEARGIALGLASPMQEGRSP